MGRTARARTSPRNPLPASPCSSTHRRPRDVHPKPLTTLPRRPGCSPTPTKVWSRRGPSPHHPPPRQRWLFYPMSKPRGRPNRSVRASRYPSRPLFPRVAFAEPAVCTVTPFHPLADLPDVHALARLETPALFLPPNQVPAEARYFVLAVFLPPLAPYLLSPFRPSSPFRTIYPRTNRQLIERL